MKKIDFLIPFLSIFLFWSAGLSAQQLSLAWKFKTNDKVLAPPTVDEGIVYVGSEDGSLYAINGQSGKEQWHYTTRGRIQGAATVKDNSVFFESDNIVYALDKKTGEEIWQYDPGWALWGYKIDPYDDKRSRPVIHDGILYIGSSLGFVLGLDINTGERVAAIPSEYQQPIRTTPLVLGNRLFFGDWAGKVYAYSLEQQKLLWTQRTYDKKPYDSFGGITSELIAHKDKLIFGARNHNLQVLDLISGQNVWQYADSTGGWIVGDPVVENNVLYIGGSDNLKMFAFHPDSGMIKWTFKAGLNVYTKPIVTEDHVIFTAGNAYQHSAPGKLFILNKEDGTLAAEYEVPEATFSSPASNGELIYFGAYDGNLYALKWK